MSIVNEQLDRLQATHRLDGLQQFGTLPNWLSAIANPGRVREALARAIPEFASGELTLQGCEIKRVRMKKDNWTAMYRLTVAEAGRGPSRVVALHGTLISPGGAEPKPTSDGVALGSDSWRFYVPELRLDLKPQPPDAALPALPILTDPEQARALLEQSIRAGSQTYPDLRIQSCEPKVMRYKPGSRCTVLYRLQYAPEDAERGWPDIVVAKTYQGDKGRIAYEGMRALWNSALAQSAAVTVAEPLGFIPEMNVLVQGPIREEQTLKELIRLALRSGTTEALDELNDYMRKTAIGLAELHHADAQIGEARSWQDELIDVREDLDRLVAIIPQLDGAAAPLLARIEALSAAHPADPPVPTHGTFRPAQVLLHKGQIGFIDFDGFCQAEPALDLALFLGKIRDIGLSASETDEEDEDSESVDRAALLALLEQTEAICEMFLSEYEKHAPVSRQRIALWETLDLLTLVLHCWTKVKPARLDINMLLLERHLGASGQI